MVVLDAAEIMALIPNRYPINYIDAVEALEPGQSIVATKLLTMNEQFVRGYLPERPQMPNTLLIEALAQTASILILKSPEFTGKTAYLGAAKQVTFFKSVYPGDQITFKVMLIKKKQNMGVVSTSAMVNQVPICEAELTFVVAERDQKIQKS